MIEKAIEQIKPIRYGDEIKETIKTTRNLFRINEMKMLLQREQMND